MSTCKVDTAFANQALALSVQHWMDLGRGQDPVTGPPDSIEEAAVRLTSIFLVRLIALYHGQLVEDLSTSTIAVAVMNSTELAGVLTEHLTPSLTLQLETYITCMLYGYVNELPFHNYQHAYHVCISANKFMESMLLSSSSSNKRKSKKSRDVFGLGSSPLSLLALLFAALVHDVGHTGVSNFQRAKDDQELADRYKDDQSLHEHHSLHVAFEELLKDEYAELRKVMFEKASHYETFRQLVFDAVLSTDIANPGRAEEAKLKYFAAFPNAGCDDDGGEGDENRRSSIASNISMPRASAQQNRRSSGQTVSSVSSDITMDSYSMMKHQNKVSRNTALTLQSWRASAESNQVPNRRLLLTRRHSLETLSSNFSEFAADSIRMTPEKLEERNRRASGDGTGPAPRQQRRMSASYNTPESGLNAVAHDLRKNPTLHRLGGKSRSKRQQKVNKRTNSLELVGAGVGSDDHSDGESSLSLTPPSSDDEDEGLNGVTKKASEDCKKRYSNGAAPSKFGSIQEDAAEEISYKQGGFDLKKEMTVTDGVPDDLRAAVVIELFLRASDVAHWYQSWDTMTHFNRRIFLELCKASKCGRGFDPRANWFDNQAKIMETYLLPLAEQIEYIGVLRKGSGIDLVGALESNNDLWLVRGFDIVETLKAEAD